MSNSSCIRLRTLARKSVLDFGQFEGRTVQQMLDLKHYRILRWYYYNCSMISFLPDILDEIGITEEWRIDKPAKDPEKGKELDSINEQKIATVRKIGYESGDIGIMSRTRRQKSKEKKRAMGKYSQFLHNDSSKFSKESMQSRNQGHF